MFLYLCSVLAKSDFTERRTLEIESLKSLQLESMQAMEMHKQAQSDQDDMVITDEDTFNESIREG